jgi:hypothetical protein
MRFGLAFVTYVYTPDRVAMTKHALTSLAKTNVTGLEKPVVRISYRPSEFRYEDYFDMLKEKFEVTCVPDSPECNSMVYAVEDAGLRIADEHPDVTHVVHLCDDRIYNPEWLIQLKGLIERHPDGLAWSVFRSAYTDFHRIIGGDGTDVLMTMHDAIGCTTAEEWRNFIKTYGYVGCPDIAHAQLRPGNRWATGRDYMENIGRHYDRGIGDVDCAIDFVGEEAINA